MQVLDDQQHARLPGRFSDRGGDGLEQPMASVLRLAPRRRGLRLQLGQQASELADHPLGKRFG
jgi:hypothetical protein